MSFLKFTDIGQFRNTVKSIRDWSDRNHKPLPILEFTGTVKLHGTNAGICVKADNTVMFQSRTHWIDPSNDNAGFAKAMTSMECQDTFIGFAESIRNEFNFDKTEQIVFYGEWCGNGINKGAAICLLQEKTFVLFAVRVGEYAWVPVDYIHSGVFTTPIMRNIYDYDVYHMDIDFSNPDYAQNELIAITQKVEEECPVARGIAGIKDVGEGVVWTTEFPIDGTHGLVARECFKVKGDKHSVTKVKKLAAVDVEKVRTINEFVDKVVTEPRLLQGISYLEEEHLDARDIRNMGAFLRWMANDVLKEESDTMIASGLEKKDVGKAVSQKAKQWYTARL